MPQVKRETGGLPLDFGDLDKEISGLSDYWGTSETARLKKEQPLLPVAEAARFVTEAPFHAVRNLWNESSLYEPIIEGAEGLHRSIYDPGYYSGNPSDILGRPQTPIEAQDKMISDAGGVAGAAMGGGLVLGGAPKGSAGVFGGRIPAAVRKVAEKMEKEGATPSEIWDKVGLERGADTKWRNEIPDYNSILLKGEGKTLADKLEHPELFNEYPELRNLPIDYNAQPRSAVYYGPTERNGPFEVKKGNSYEFDGKKYDMYDIIDKNGKKIDDNILDKSIAEDIARRMNEGRFGRISLPPTTSPLGGGPNRGMLLHEVSHAIQDIHDFGRGGSPDYIKKLAQEKSVLPPPITEPTAVPHIDDIAGKMYGKQFHQLGADDQASVLAYEAYMRIAGEAEARNVSKRAMMKPEELKDLPPRFTEDRPRDVQTVLTRGREPMKSVEPEYRGEHSAPDNESGSPLHDVSANGTYPKDFYSPEGLRYYGTGDDALDAVTYRKILSFKDKPDELVNVYRAIPWEGKKPIVTLSGNKERSKINPGDWVTLSKKYAEDHGESTLNGKYAITMKRVPAKELFTSGDSMHEWGWSPKSELPGTESLSYLLGDKSKIDVIGKEVGTVKPDGISVLKVADAPEGYGANRLVYTKDGKIIGAMQVTKLPNSNVYKVANTFVDPEFRRQGIATKLNEEGNKIFGKLESSDLEASPAGQSFRNSVLRSDTSKTAPLLNAGLRMVEKLPGTDYQIGYHGTKTPGFEKFKVPEAGQYMPDRALGTHISKDPAIADSFVIPDGWGKEPEGGVYPVKIPHDSKFFEINQDLLPYIKDRNTVKNNRNVGSDQNAIESAIFKAAYTKEPDMFARFLEQRWNMSKEKAVETANSILKGEPTKIMDGRSIKGLDDYIKYDGVVKAWNETDRAKAIEIFKKDLQDKGYEGVKYINTSPMETQKAKDFTSYIVFDPSKSIRSKYTNQLMSDTGPSGTVLNAALTEARAPRFYSGLEMAAKMAKIKEGTPEQWLGAIKNTPGVKAEELLWTGLPEWLAEQNVAGKNEPVKITKQQVEDYIAAHKIEIKEHHKGGITDRDEIAPDQIASDKYIKEWDELVAERQRLQPLVDDYNRRLKGDEWEKAKADFTNVNKKMDDLHYKMVDETIERAGGLNPKTKFNDPKYRLPGGENYREIVFTLPTEMQKYNEFTEGLRAKYGQGGFDNLPLTKQERNTLDKLMETAGDDGVKPYTSTHWSEANPFAHTRVNDRFIPDPNGPSIGKDGEKGFKVLHAEEVQSDMHQAGRKYGYKFRNEAEKAKAEEVFNGIDDKIVNSGNEAIMGNPNIKEALKLAVEEKIITPVEAKQYFRYTQAEHLKSVPDAPFKQNWDEIVMKRLIRYAAENGYDAIGWTPGAKQAERFDLSQHIEKLHIVKTDKGYLLGPEAKNGSEIPINNGKAVPENEIASYIGEEVAKKIIDNKNYKDGKVHTLENLDLKIGAEKMEKYYDEILKNKVNDISKKFGSEVETRNLGDLNPAGWHITSPSETVSGKWMVKSKDYNSKGFHFNTEAEARANLAQQIAGERTPQQPIHFLKLSDKLKDTALHKGFSLFSSGLPGMTFVPVDHDPFEKFKLVPVEGNPFQ